MRAVTTRARTASSATKMLSSFDRRLSVIERAQNLRYSSIDGGIPVTDADGNVRVVIGVQEDGTYGVGTQQLPHPPDPRGPPGARARGRRDLGDLPGHQHHQREVAPGHRPGRDLRAHRERHGEMTGSPTYETGAHHRGAGLAGREGPRRRLPRPVLG